MNFQILCTKQVKGFPVSMANNGGIYFGRDLFDLLRDDLQGKHFTAKSIREFESVCRILAA